jgi:hypothetical protein
VREVGEKRPPENLRRVFFVRSKARKNGGLVAQVCEYAFMRTTLEIPDGVFKRAKLKAVEEGVSLKTVIVRAIEREVGGSADARARRKRANRLFAALDKSRNDQPVGKLKREELYDRSLLRGQ